MKSNSNADELLPDNIVTDRHGTTGKWTFQYLTDEQAEKCFAALSALPSEGDGWELDNAAKEVLSCFMVKPTNTHNVYNLGWVKTTDETIEALLKLDRACAQNAYKEGIPDEKANKNNNNTVRAFSPTKPEEAL